jgi:hypothetical protein
LVPYGSRFLGNELLREVVVEIGECHKKYGILELWNDGIMGKPKKMSNTVLYGSKTRESNILIFHLFQSSVLLFF